MLRGETELNERASTAPGLQRRAGANGWRGRKLAAILAATGLLLAACGGDDDDDASSDTDGTPTATSDTPQDGNGSVPPTDEPPAEEPSAEEPPAEEPSAEEPSGEESSGEESAEGTFVFGYPRSVTRLDPHQAASGFDGTTLFPAYDRLVHLAPDGEFIPGLAESWEFNEDATRLTLHIRPDVTFHDGAVLDAGGVKVNLDRARTMEGSSVATDLRSIEEVVVEDAMTVALELNRSDVSLLGPLSDRAGILVSPQAIADGVNLDEEMVGAGPFMMVEHTPDATTVFERFPDYWDEDNRARVASLELRVLPDEVTRFNALRAGELSAAQIGPGQVDQAGDAGLEVIDNLEFQFIQLIQNRSRAQQDDLRVRQAIVHAIDREGICAALYFGRCQVSDQPFPPGYFAFSEEIDQVLYPYDPERARELLAEAGVEELEIGMMFSAGQTPYPEIAEAIQAQLAEVGITLRLEPSEQSQLAELMFAQEAADSLLSGASGRPDPSQYMYARMDAEAFGNPGGHVSPDITELIAETLSTGDPEARATALQAASAEIATSLLEVVILFPEIQYGLQEGVTYVPYVTGKPEFREVDVS